MDRDLRLNLLLRELAHCGVALRLEHGRLHIQHGANLTAALCDEITELRAELVDYLSTQGEEVIDYTAGDAEGKLHSGMRSPPRTPEEVEKQRADADRTRESARRRYQGGMVLINDPNNFGHYMRQLRRQREASAAAERGELPLPGRYVTRFSVFGKLED